MKLTTLVSNLINAEKEYASNLFNQRTVEKVGSYLFETTVVKAVEIMLTAEFEVITHPAVKINCYKSVDQFLGVIGVQEIKDTDKILLDDPKNTGFAQAHVQRDSDCPEYVDMYHIYAIGNDAMIFTFHPGEPEATSDIPFTGKKWVKGIEAKKLGFTMAKLID